MEIGEHDSLDVLFGGIEDPRVDRSKIYSLQEIFFLALVGSICGVDTWRGLQLFGNERIALLRKYLPFDQGIPSHQTLGRVFSLVRPKAFEQSFIEFTKNYQRTTNGEIIAIDGKTVRGSRQRKSSSPLHLLDAWAVKNGLTLAQLEVGKKTNEITAVPTILKMLDIRGATITVDALNCQKEIANEVVKGGADYVFTVKGNQKSLHDGISSFFENNPIPETSPGFYETTDKGHGRIEHRCYYSAPAESVTEATEWPGVRSIGMVISNVFRGDKPTSEARFFITSLGINSQRLAEAVRGHWAVENSLHWVLDVTFDEDACKVRKDYAPRNFATIRKTALNILKLNREKGSLKGKRMKALMTPSYLDKLLNEAGFR